MNLPTLLLVGACIFAVAGTCGAQEKKPASIYDLTLVDIDGKKVDLAKYKGKVVLIVNVASECGYTAQYKGLQELHAKYAKQGLAVLGIPCNDFGGQEPKGEKDIKEFAKSKYGVEFDLFSKSAITSKPMSPLYELLTSKANAKTAGAVRWNFEKFIIGRDGRIIARFASDTEPDNADFLDLLRKELEKK